MTDYLYAHPSFVEGVARILDFGGTLTMFNGSRTADEADARAAFEDWRAVGDDLRAAVQQIKRETRAQ